MIKYLTMRNYACPTWLTRHLPRIELCSLHNSNNSKTLDHRIAKLVRVGNVTELSRIIHLHYDSLHRTDVYWATIISSALGRTNDQDKWNRIHKIWMDLLERNKINAVVISTYLDLCGFHGNLDYLKEAWGLLNEQKPWIIVNNHYNSYIQALVKLGANEDALRTLQSMQLHRITCKTLVTIIEPLRKKPLQNQEILLNCWKWIESNGLLKIRDVQETKFSRRWRKLVEIHYSAHGRYNNLNANPRRVEIVS